MVGCIEQLTKRLTPVIDEIIHHDLYHDISSIADLQLFMGEHVFAVWDFMCLLKELHRLIVSTSAPWFPPKDALSANLISSILVEEEGDLAEDGSYASHFDIYLLAMEKIGADTIPIKRLLLALGNGKSIEDAIDLVPLRPGTKQFVLTTFSFFKRSIHELAAAFVYGREGVTACMFEPLLQQLEAQLDRGETQYSTLVYYFKRHIDLDSNAHFPKALKMLENFIGDDNKKLKEAEQAAFCALNARISFLSDIHACIQQKQAITLKKNI